MVRSGGGPARPPRAPLTGQDGLRFWGEVLREAEKHPLQSPVHQPDPPPSIASVDRYLSRMTPSLSDERFKTAVARAIDYIAAGDIYQVNLSRRLTGPAPAGPLDLYVRLCRANPAWYAAYLAFDDKAVLSSSPELFLQVRGDHVITRPIKGTRPRVCEPSADHQAREQLLASARTARSSP